MSDYKPCSTPLEPKCTPADFANSELFEGPFRELIGSLLYLAVKTRPDILFSVNCLSQLQEKPTVAAWIGLKRILRYLKGTKNFKLVYKKLHNPNFTIDLYVDSDTIDRKSVSGYALMFCNCPILWCCKKQNCISLSSTEAEIIALGVQCATPSSAVQTSSCIPRPKIIPTANVVGKLGFIPIVTHDWPKNHGLNRLVMEVVFSLNLRPMDAKIGTTYHRIWIAGPKSAEEPHVGWSGFMGIAGKIAELEKMLQKVSTDTLALL
ncbi:Copia protein [Araneus ventricosus]|uniref:Copia protein n=1 Tax=Araneus ventricosus TaxID=182803 RepID=A0A4Y2RDX0_ARAVE|nr:Copia protein [Araneus ventricosus]